MKHREYDNQSDSGLWKSLGLNTYDGDSTKTEHFEQYTKNEPSEYSLTEVAHLCPTTLDFLSQLINISDAKRIRFMLLEPGAKIRVHTDASPGTQTQLAINIAFNMPEGCEFHIETAPDGKHISHTKQVPFQAGSAMLVNVAKFHYVENNSNENRIHIIVHAPIRIPEPVLIQKARNQNLVKSEKKLVNRLVLKQAEMNLLLEKSVNHAWLTQSIDPKIFTNIFKILLLDSAETSEANRNLFLNNYSGASLFPVEFEVCEFTQLNQWLKEQKDDRFILILRSGIFTLNLYDFIYEIARSTFELKRNSHLLCAFTEERENEIDARALILNPKVFSELGYPPLMLQADSSTQWNKNLLDPSIEGISNLEANLKKNTLYAAASAEEQNQISEVIDRIESYDINRVFPFNNEPLWQSLHPSFRAKRFLSVAAGLKPIIFARDYFDSSVETFFLDRSVSALKFYDAILKCKSKQECLEIFAEQFEKLGESKESAFQTACKNFDSYIKMQFKGNFSEFQNKKRCFRPVQFQEIDFLRQPDLLLSFFEPGIKTIFWYSNSWRNTSSLYRFTTDELKMNFESLVRKLAPKLRVNAWINQNGPYNAILGDSFDNPLVYFIDNLGETPKEKDFRKIELRDPAVKMEDRPAF